MKLLSLVAVSHAKTSLAIELHRMSLRRIDTLRLVDEGSDAGGAMIRSPNRIGDRHRDAVSEPISLTTMGDRRPPQTTAQIRHTKEKQVSDLRR